MTVCGGGVCVQVAADEAYSLHLDDSLTLEEAQDYAHMVVKVVAQYSPPLFFFLVHLQKDAFR